jgi:hypothetical protein
LTDDLRAEAAAYGYTADDFEIFGSEQALLANMRRDNRALRTEAEQRRAQSPHNGQAPPPAAPPAAKTPAPTAQTPEAQTPSDRLAPIDANIAKLKAEYGDETLSATMDAMRGMLAEQHEFIAEQRQARDQLKEQLQQQQQAQAQHAYVTRLNDLEQRVIKLGLTDLLGADYDHATEPQKAKWREIIDSLDVLDGGAMQRGRALPEMSDAYAKRVVYSAFPDQLHTKAKQDVAKSVRKQSAQRLGAGNRAAHDGPAAAYQGPVENDPVVVKAFADLLGDPKARLRAG